MLQLCHTGQCANVPDSDNKSDDNDSGNEDDNINDNEVANKQFAFLKEGKFDNVPARHIAKLILDLCKQLKKLNQNNTEVTVN